MLDLNKYKNKYAYPKKFVMVCRVCGNRISSKNNFCGDCGNNVADDYKNYKVEHAESIAAYNKEEARLLGLFKHDALDYVGLLDHPRSSDIFNFAWDKGHSYGYSGVLNELEDVCDLFK